MNIRKALLYCIYYPLGNLLNVAELSTYVVFIKLQDIDIMPI